MTLFESLILAHILGDWLLQTEWQAVNKLHDWRPLLAHVAVYHLVMLAVLFLRFGFRDPYSYIAVAALALSHAFLDRQWPVLGLMRVLRITRERPPERWLTVALDQSLHLLLLGLATLFLVHRPLS
jgi:hypothetical protein